MIAVDRSSNGYREYDEVLVDRVLQIHGGMGYTKDLPIERWYRELRLLRIFEGTDEIQRRTIARNLLKGHVRLGGIGE